MPVLTTLCYIEKDDKYLMLHRVKKKNDINHDKWLGIGGKLEKNESPEECLLREVFEETGLRLNSFRRRGFITFCNDDYCEYMFLFTSDDFSGELKSSSDCEEGVLEWVDKEDIFKLPLWEGDLIFLDKLIKAPEEELFSLKLVYSGDKLSGHEFY